MSQLNSEPLPSQEKRSDFKRPSLAIVALVCDPHKTMEHRNSWHRALQATEHFNVTILCGPEQNEEELRRSVPPEIPSDRLKVVVIPVDRWTKFCLANGPLFYFGYRSWLHQVGQYIRKRKEQFDLIHLVSLCGYREPGPFWKLDIPFLWGPVGGTSGYPIRYLRYADLSGGLVELVRNAVNCFQLRWSKRIQAAAKKSWKVYAANSTTHHDLHRFMGIRTEIELETGLDFPIDPPRSRTSEDQPLKILWVGRLRTWKGLPLLLHAISRLERGVSVQLRVVGEGKCLHKWRALAKRLGIDHCVEWIARPCYRSSYGHYQWSDVFAFTSLRDTSGTGLLESLAMGAPLLGLNHQGAGDIMSEDCSIPISTRSPEVSIQELTDGITRLARDRDLLLSMSHAARKRAELYHWSNRRDGVMVAYREFASNFAEENRSNVGTAGHAPSIDENGRSTPLLEPRAKP